MPTRQHFEAKMEVLQAEILKMGELLEQAISKAGKAFLRQDSDLAQLVVEGDQEINHMERLIEELCVSTIATEQPVATDLRMIVAALKISNDLERIGDYAEHLANISLKFTAPPAPSEFSEIPQMAEVAATMIHDSLQAFVNKDRQKALDALLRDDKVDELYLRVFQRLTNYIKEHPESLRQSISLLFAGKFLERLADHAANVSEEVLYVCTGTRDKPDQNH